MYIRLVGSLIAQHPAEEIRLVKAWLKLGSSNPSVLKHFNLLYQIFAFLRENQDRESLYIELLRSQLTGAEEALLFYNCVYLKAQPGGAPKVLTDFLTDERTTAQLQNALIDPKHLSFLQDDSGARPASQSA